MKLRKKKNYSKIRLMKLAEKVKKKEEEIKEMLQRK